MKKTKKGKLILRCGMGATASLLIASVCVPALDSVANAEEVSPPTFSSSLLQSEKGSSSVVEVPQATSKTTEVADTTENSQTETSQPPTTTTGNSSSGVSSSTGSTASTGSTGNTSTSVPAVSKPSTPGVSGSSSSTPAGSSKPQTSGTSKEATSGSISYSKNQSTAEFVNRIGQDAREVADKNDLYASIMIAQAILESASGNSTLAREPNFNLFGIKGSYNGKSVGMATLEDNGSGGMYSITANFRKYSSYKESLEDYAQLLNGSFYSGARKSNTSSFKDATQFLTGRYATDTLYNQKLNGLIEAYNLRQYDDAKKLKVKVKITSHKVAANETIWDVAKRYGSTIKRIRELNEFKEDKFTLVPDSEIIVKREIIKDDTENDVASKEAKSLDSTELSMNSPERKKLEKEAKEVVLIKLRQLGHNMKEAVPSALFDTNKFKVVGTQIADTMTYSVQKGDTIKTISKKVGVPIEKLVEWNNLQNTILTEGQGLLTSSPFANQI